MTTKYLDSSGLSYFWGKVKSFFVKGNGKVFTGTCSTAAATTEKAVTCSDFTAADLVAGTIITVKFDNTNSGAIASLTLNVNGTGAMPIKYIYNGGLSDIPAKNYLKAGQMYHFYYDGTNWVVEMNYNTSGETNYSLRHYNNIKARKAITAESLIVGDSTGFEKVGSGVTFDITYPIVWCTADVAKDAQNYNNMFLMLYDRNMQTGIKSGYTSTAGKVQYLVVTISGNIATIDSSIVTDTLPSTDDGKVYIEIGRLGAQSTGANLFFLYPAHHFWWYKNGALRQYGDYGHTVNSDVPADADMTAYTGTSPISVSNHAISHAASGVTAASKGDTSNQTPAFGSTFKALSGTVNATGHLTAFAEHTVKIPDTKASTSGYGITKLSTSTSSTATDLAATPSAVKTAKDRADDAYSKAATVESGLNGTLIYDHTYTISNGVATFTPHVYLKGAEVTTDYASSCFTWKYRLIDGSEVNLTTKSDRGCDVTISNMGYGGTVIGSFTPA